MWASATYRGHIIVGGERLAETIPAPKMSPTSHCRKRGVETLRLKVRAPGLHPTPPGVIKEVEAVGGDTGQCAPPPFLPALLISAAAIESCIVLPTVPENTRRAPVLALPGPAALRD